VKDLDRMQLSFPATGPIVEESLDDRPQVGLHGRQAWSVGQQPNVMVVQMLSRLINVK